eukprot:2299186-Amphidinium_carterae.1
MSAISRHGLNGVWIQRTLLMISWQTAHTTAGAISQGRSANRKCSFGGSGITLQALHRHVLEIGGQRQPRKSGTKEL